ncbi:MAG TPA: dUTP diphosphatase [Pyrinomonadaceae bacterium]|jgi:dUTP pyrophosphatase
MFERLKFGRLHPSAKLPTRGTPQAAGLDLYSIEALSIPPGGRASAGTGLSVAIPVGFYGRIAPRSGLAVRFGLDVLAGVVDADYRGELRCVLVNHGAETVELEAGSRVAQLLVEVIAMPQAVWSDELDATERGEAGFGSTG